MSDDKVSDKENHFLVNSSFDAYDSCIYERKIAARTTEKLMKDLLVTNGTSACESIREELNKRCGIIKEGLDLSKLPQARGEEETRTKNTIKVKFDIEVPLIYTHYKDKKQETNEFELQWNDTLRKQIEQEFMKVINEKFKVKTSICGASTVGLPSNIRDAYKIYDD